jgi:hypothetical protein
VVVAVTGTGPAPRVIALWSHPRALSTAFFRMMVERGDVLALHEPFANLAAVGRYDEVGEPVADPAGLLAAIFRQADRRPVFLKDTTEYPHAALLDLPGMLDRVTHTFIVRDPLAAIPSHYAVNPAVTSAEIGYEHQYRIFARVRAARGAAPLVIEAERLLADPAGTVRHYCEHVGLPFRPEALSWSAGTRPEWARTDAWHQDVNRSVGFQQRAKEYPVRVDNDERLAAWWRHHRPFYAELQRHSPGPAADRRQPAGAREEGT